MGKGVFLLLVLVAGVLAWYRKHLQFQDKRGLAYSISPEFGGHFLLAGSILLTAAVLFVAWRELFADRRSSDTPERPEAAGQDERTP